MRERNLHVTVKKLLSQTHSSKNWRQKQYYVCRYRKLLQSIEFWHMYVQNLLSRIDVRSFCFFGLFFLFLKSTVCNCCTASRFIANAYIGNIARSWCMLWELIPRKHCQSRWFFPCGWFNQEILLASQVTSFPWYMQQVFCVKVEGGINHSAS